MICHYEKILLASIRIIFLTPNGAGNRPPEREARWELKSNTFQRSSLPVC